MPNIEQVKVEDAAVIAMDRRGPDTPRNHGQSGDAPRKNVAHPSVPPSWKSAPNPPEQTRGNLQSPNNDQQQDATKSQRNHNQGNFQ